MSLLCIHKMLLPAGVALLLMAEAPGQDYTSPRDHTPTGRMQQDPGDLYLQAYRLCRESEMLASRKSYQAALKKGQEAERILASIVRDYPTWSTNLVTTRRRLLAENLAEYRKQIGEDTMPRPTPGGHSELPGKSPIASGNIPLPNYNTPNKDYGEYNRLKEECRKLAEAYRDLYTLHQETLKQLTAVQLEQKTYKERYEKLQRQMEEDRIAGNTYVDSLSRKIQEMETKYRASEAALREAEARANDLELRLAQTKEDLAKVESERDHLQHENEQLRAIVELNSPEKTKALLDQNLTLAEQLKAAQSKIQELEALQSGTNDENAVLAKQLDEARAEASRLRDEMNVLFDENAGYRKRISELTEQLNNLEADLATRADQPQIDPAMAEENKVLRSIIEKQRHTIAMQEESRKLLLETYKALKKDDPELMNVLKKLEADGPQELTAAERKILEDVRNGVTEQSNETVRRTLQVETLSNLATQAFNKKRYISAEQLYLTLYDIQPDNVAGLVNLGTILIYNNKCDQALEYLTRATRLAPDMAICHYLTGIAAYRLEQLATAQKLFTRTVQLDPGNAEAFFYLANIEAIAGHTERALKHFAAAVKIKPELADAHYNMARLYAESSKMPEAARSYDRAIRNGATPDLEFEQYLRRHPDTGKAPGADLVAIVRPENEARSLPVDPEDTPQQPAADTAPEEKTEQAATEPAETQIDLFQELVHKTENPVAAVSTPSPAGKGHETDASMFRSIRMRTPLGTRMLRVKRPEPVRLRTRGEDTIQEMKNASRAR